MTTQQTFDILDGLDNSSFEQRLTRMKNYLRQQKEEILEKLEIDEYQTLTLRRNRYTYCLEELELGINMFSLAIKHVVSVFFPLMMEDKHLITLSEDDVNAKVVHLRSTIDKSWNILYKQLVRLRDAEPDLRTKRIKKQECSTSRRGSNCKIPKEATCVLQRWLLQNFNDPYPSQHKKVEMAKESGLTVYQVNNWFINARERIVKKFHKKESTRLTRQLQI